MNGVLHTLTCHQGDIDCRRKYERIKEIQFLSNISLIDNIYMQYVAFKN